MSAGMHDNPALWPTLPGRDPDEHFEALVGPNRGTPFEECWEFVLTHDLTPAEGSAFWHGVNLVYQAMQQKDGAA